MTILVVPIHLVAANFRPRCIPVNELFLVVLREIQLERCRIRLHKRVREARGFRAGEARRDCILKGETRRPRNRFARVPEHGLRKIHNGLLERFRHGIQCRMIVRNAERLPMAERLDAPVFLQIKAGDDFFKWRNAIHLRRHIAEHMILLQKVHATTVFVAAIFLEYLRRHFQDGRLVHVLRGKMAIVLLTNPVALSRRRHAEKFFDLFFRPESFRTHQADLHIGTIPLPPHSRGTHTVVIHAERLHIIADDDGFHAVVSEQWIDEILPPALHEEAWFRILRDTVA